MARLLVLLLLTAAQGKRKGVNVKKKEKVDLKGGILNERELSRDEIIALSKLPGIESLRAQLLGLLSQPATGFVRVINAVPQGLVNVLQAKVREAEGA